jgi:hypothetical protein
LLPVVWPQAEFGLGNAEFKDLLYKTFSYLIGPSHPGNCHQQTTGADLEILNANDRDAVDRDSIICVCLIRDKKS